MPGRRIPDGILAYLGSYKKAVSVEDKIAEQVMCAKLEGEFTGYDPLVTVMVLVTEEVLGVRLSPKGPRGRQIWINIMRMAQEEPEKVSFGFELGHNRFIPCRFCDQAFLPVIDEKLLLMFLDWYNSNDPEKLLSIHRCPSCGGQLKTLEIRKYSGDRHTPLPGSIDDHNKWVDTLFRYS